MHLSVSSMKMVQVTVATIGRSYEIHSTQIPNKHNKGTASCLNADEHTLSKRQ